MGHLTEQSSENQTNASTQDAAFAILRPNRQTAPVVFASPHSGNHYPDGFVQTALLDPISLRRSEDAFVDELYENCIKFGSPLLKAHFPRAYVDVNREPYELDPDMFDTVLPSYVNIESQRALAGLGTVARIVANGEEIYPSKLSFEDIRNRIETLYHPYHAALRQLIEETRGQFGSCLLIDCHSMPSSASPFADDPKLYRTDIVLGDRFGTSCHEWVTDLAHQILEGEGFTVRRNKPYAGGFTTQHYGEPKKRVHALQIELSRALYMNEENITRIPELRDVKQRLQNFTERMCAICAEEL